jgi:uncharacterized protein (DUF1800 family)
MTPLLVPARPAVVFRQGGCIRRRALLFAAVGAVWLCVQTPRAATLPDNDAAIEQALNRLTFGARPGDVARVRVIGLESWIARQLDPRQIDDSSAEAMIPALPTPPSAFATPQDARRFGRTAVQALAAAKVTRAVHSERQLEELLVDFWFNHFNVFAGKGRTGLYVPDYEREAIRPHVLGRFRSLLGATAKSPAMLFYLDNWMSAAPDSARLRPAQPGAGRRGLNENYARELLELHTLGVDGGYTQQDIVDVARIFTGWTFERQASDPGFRFARGLHDRGEKRVLGQLFPAGAGIEEGERLLDILAAHPSTARHIATKLARRFVSDTPPAALIARAAARFRESGGDLRDVVRLIVTSPEFFAQEARGAKVKTPLEFVASAVRAVPGAMPPPRMLVRALRDLGMEPYMCQPPTGYADDADAWINAGALVARMNIAQQIARNQAPVVGGPDFQRR